MNTAANKAGDETRPYVVTVDFAIKPNFLSEFMDLISENAKASVTLEEHCLRFDVLTPISSEADKVFLYEIYTSQAAFENHLTTQHYKKFDRATAHMVVSKSPKAFVVDEHIKDHQ